MNASKAIDMPLHRILRCQGVAEVEFGSDPCARCGREEEEEDVAVLLATRRASKSCKKKFQTNAIKDRMLNHIHQSRTIFFSHISDNCAKHRTGIRSEIVLRVIPQESLHIGGGIDGFVEDCNAVLKPG